MEDNVIIDMYFERDQRAITETKAKYGAYCRKIAFNILLDREDAEECENDAYLGAWNTIPPQRPKIFSAFLGKLTRNISVMRLRSRSAEKRGGGAFCFSINELDDCIPDGSSFDSRLDSVTLAESLNSFLRALPTTDRLIFVRRYWFCDSISAIAETFGFGESKVKMTLSRTRKKLGTFLAKEGFII